MVSVKKIFVVILSLFLLVGCSNNYIKSTESSNESVNLFKKEIKNITLAEMKVKNVPDEISEESIDAVINPMIEQSGILVINKSYLAPSAAMIKNGDEMVGGIKIELNLEAEGNEESICAFLDSLANLDTKFTISNISVNKIVDKYELLLGIVFYSNQNIIELKSDNNLGSISKVENYKEEDTSVKLRNYDFIGIIRPIESDMSAIRFGANDDSDFSKTIYADKNEMVTVNLELTQEGKKYYFRYYTNEDSYPEDNKMEEFKPTQKEILIDILSCKRLHSADNSGINLIVNNKTNKKVNIMVHDDDIVSRVTQIVQ